MAEERARRRLSAILAADVVGYSRLMEADEEGTLIRLKALRRETIDPAVAGHRGRLVKLTGDGALVEFASAVDAVRCAAAIQQAVAERQQSEPPERRITLRVGINLGDIIADDDDVYGDGVNIAARLEALAEPGGILISGGVHEQVAPRLQYRFDDLGEQKVKNIDRPVRTWRVCLDGHVAEPAAAATRGAGHAERPGIAVLPFANMSGDPEQEYFADGMVEEIITGLARIRWLTVIARNSTFAYKGKSPDVRHVGRDLAVRYALEGSVRRAGNRVRINAQLVDTETGGHLWAEKFDGTLADVFDLQDEITAGVVAAIEPSVRRAEIERAKRKRPGNLDAHDLYLRALEQAYTFTPAGREAALALLDSAIALDPGYAEAHGIAAWCRQQRYLWGGRAPEDREAAIRHAETVAAAGTDDATTLAFAAFAIAALARSHEAALVMLERALSLNPSSAAAHAVGAVVNMIIGRYDRCQWHAERALRLSPFDPLRYIPEIASAAAGVTLSQNESALLSARRGLEANPVFAPGLVVMALCLVRLGRLEEARAAIRRLVEIAPDTTVATVRERLLFSDALYKGFLDDLRAAGLPE
jgi:TolB-like protein/class 3 adenylate cyclase/tetratricopeptide (TPR) repeat protein